MSATYYNVEVQVEDVGIVVPSQPRPDSVLPLTFIDLCCASIVKVICVYSPPKHEEMVSDLEGRMKQALAKVLVPYYFMAGRMVFNPSKNKPEIVCNGAGAIFISASCDMALDECLQAVKHPSSSFKTLNLEPQDVNMDQEHPPLLILQVTRLRGGGVVVGFSINHVILDGIAIMQFVSNFASIMRGGGVLQTPSPDRSVLNSREPPTWDELPMHVRDVYFGAKKLYTPTVEDLRKCRWSFPYSMKMLQTLRHEIIKEGAVKSFSATQLLIAIIWKARTIAIGMEDDIFSVTVVGVNIRSRINPPLPPGFAGNGVLEAICCEKAGEVKTKPLSYCVQRVHDSISQFADNEHIRSTIDFREHHKFVSWFPGSLIVSVVHKFPYGDVDFGWGRVEHAVQGGDVDGMYLDLASLAPSYKGDEWIDINITIPHRCVHNFKEALYFPTKLNPRI